MVHLIPTQSPVGISRDGIVACFSFDVVLYQSICGTGADGSAASFACCQLVVSPALVCLFSSSGSDPNFYLILTSPFSFLSLSKYSPVGSPLGLLTFLPHSV